jgi:hypothetical protein
MATPVHEPFIAYLLVHATMLRGHQPAPAAAALLAEHVNALELLVDVVRDLPEDDERLQMLATLAVRHGQFAPGPAADHAITRFAGASRTVCETFLTTLVHIALDDALGQARDHGVLPPKRPQ